jgi:hypothetical protein
VFCNNDRVVDEKERWGMKVETMWRIQADVTNKGYNFQE